MLRKVMILRTALMVGVLFSGSAFAQETHGKASWYGDQFQGKTTAGGGTFDKNELTAAHPTLPLGSTVEVTNPKTGQSVEVEINDRGPMKPGRTIDLSERAAEEIGIRQQGVADVIVKPAGKE
jgi:rare lipoprotein A